MEYNLGKKRTGTTPSPVTVVKKLATPQKSPIATTPVDKTGGAAKKPAKSDDQYEKKIYTDAIIQTMLDGYIIVHPSMWDYIPTGAHVRYFKKVNKPRTEKFKPGGFVKNHFTGEDGKKFIMLETKPGGKRGDYKYVQFPVAYEDVEELWKKYDRTAFIEIHLISTSLAQKKKQIEDLTTRVAKLETLLAGLVDRLTKK